MMVLQGLPPDLGPLFPEPLLYDRFFELSGCECPAWGDGDIGGERRELFEIQDSASILFVPR